MESKYGKQEMKAKDGRADVRYQIADDSKKLRASTVKRGKKVRKAKDESKRLCRCRNATLKRKRMN